MNSLEDLYRARADLKKDLSIATGGEGKRRLETHLALIDKEIEDERNELSRTLTEYLNQIIDRGRLNADMYSDLPIIGRKISEKSSGLREEVVQFLDLRATNLRLQNTHIYAEKDPSIEHINTFDEFYSKVKGISRVALIGEPGSGKTSTLNKLSVEIAKAALQKESLFEAVIPLYVNLADWEGGSLKEYIEGLLDDYGIQSIDRKAIFYLVDGLNETSISKVEHVKEWISSFSTRRAVVACRQIDYHSRNLSLPRFEITPLDVFQIKEFLEKLSDTKESTDKNFWAIAGERTKSLWEWYKSSLASKSLDERNIFIDFWTGDIGRALSYEVEKSSIKNIQDEYKNRGRLPGVLNICQSPYILLLCLGIVFKGKSIKNKGDLFFEVVDEMLQIRGRIVKTELIEKVTEFLSKVAYLMILGDYGTAVKEKVLFEYEMGGYTLDEKKELLRYALNSDCVQLVDAKNIGNKKYKFKHQLLQEYFAAVELGKEIKNGKLADQIWPKEEWWSSTGWEEVFLFLVSLDNEASEELIDWVLPANPTLAFKALQESGELFSDTLREKILSFSDGIFYCPYARSEWGRVYSEIHSSQEGIGIREDMPDIAFIEVPSGSFNFGGESELQRLGLLVDQTKVDINYSYYIAKYPVTYKQFELFIKSGGYANKKYWSELGWNLCSSIKQPRLFDDPRYNFPNHPVVGVTWFEAVAFSRWLDDLWKSSSDVTFTGLENIAGEKKEGWQISLPLECEWEYAAKYPDNRKFPWGNKYKPASANIDEIYPEDICGPYRVYRTTPVGIYSSGISSLGIHDMCGNVWEWCLSIWDTIYRFPELVSYEGSYHRGVRGGSWYNSRRFAYNSAHDCHDADLGVNDIGFRLCVVPSSRNTFRLVKTDFQLNTKKIIILGKNGSGKTEFIKSSSDIPLVSVSKRFPGIEEKWLMDYGRMSRSDLMLYLYAVDKGVVDVEQYQTLFDDMGYAIYIINGFEKNELTDIKKIKEVWGKKMICYIRQKEGEESTDMLVKHLQDMDVKYCFGQCLEQSSCKKALDLLITTAG